MVGPGGRRRIGTPRRRHLVVTLQNLRYRVLDAPLVSSVGHRPRTVLLSTTDEPRGAVSLSSRNRTLDASRPLPVLGWTTCPRLR